MKLTTHFELWEFMPQDIYEKWGDKCIWFLDPRLPVMAEFIRVWFDSPMTINSWMGGGVFNYRGFRPPSNKVGGALSQHRFGRAIDFNIAAVSPDEIREEILKNEKKFISVGLTTLEHKDFAKTWVHADIRTTKMNKIKIVKP